MSLPVSLVPTSHTTAIIFITFKTLAHKLKISTKQGVRTAHWMKTKVQHGKDHLLDNFKHHEREPGIETEV